MFSMRFDMRACAIGAPTTELYATAIDMCAWAETRGCLGAVLCEHHGSDDGYLPTPLILASAVAARTEHLVITSVVILPLYDPVRLAEEMAVLDIISRGRVSYILGLGYRDTPAVCFVADDVDKAWHDLGPYLLHDARTYADWNPGNDTSAGIADVHTVAELRANSRSHRIFSVAQAITHLRDGGMLTLAPLCGGLPPDLAWPYLDRVANAVVPALGQKVPDQPSTFPQTEGVQA
jgi:hypothetical protein